MAGRIVPGAGELLIVGSFDGSRALELVNHLRDQPTGVVVVDFSRVDAFEPFGVEVLVRALRGGRRPILRARGVPPCVAEELRGLGIPVLADSWSRH